METPATGTLKILFLATRDWTNPGAAGGDIQMWEYARYLAAQGHIITFVAAGYAGASSKQEIDNIQVVRLGGLLSLWLTTFLYYMRHCRDKYDVVVAEGFGGSRIPRLTPLYVKEPIITEWHQVHDKLFANQYPGFLVPILNLLERMTAYVHRNTLVRAGTPEWQAAFPRIGFKRENVFLVPVSIRDDWLNEENTTQVREPRIIWLGKFRRYKCPHHLISAMRGVVAQIPEAHLLLVGRHDDRGYEAELLRMVEEYGLGRHVEFRFDVSEFEKKDLLKHSRVLIVPSSVEGFGIVVLEANACGLPVIASDGVPESVVRHGENGLRYSFSDVDALARSIVQILQDDELHRRLCAGSHSFARQFAWSKVGAQFEGVVKHLAPQGKPVSCRISTRELEHI